MNKYLLASILSLLFSFNSFAEVQKLKLISKDKKMEVTLSNAWQERQTAKPSHQLSAKIPDSNAYMLLISESKEDFKDINAYAKIIISQMSETIEDIKVSEPEKISINNNPALRYEIRGFIDGLNVVYLQTIVETATRYNQVLGWTVSSRYVANKPILEQIAYGLKEL